MPTAKMNWKNARKKKGAPCDTADIFREEPKFNPSREQIQEAVDQYLKNGGSIETVVVDEIHWTRNQTLSRNQPSFSGACHRLRGDPETCLRRQLKKAATISFQEMSAEGLESLKNDKSIIDNAVRYNKAIDHGDNNG
jgi:hypothetical protein